MVVLSLEGPRHLKFASIEAEVGAPGELIRESLLIHTLFNSVDDVNNIINIFLEFLTLLQTIHRDEVGLLVRQGI